LDSQVITPLLVSLLIGWSIYRRARRSIGRQPVRQARLWLRVAVFAVIGALVLVASITNARLLAALAGGAVGGVALGFIGLRHTKFEATSQGEFYTPHTYIGLIVSALFIARIAFRFMSIYLAPRASAMPINPFDQYQRSPLTLAIFGILVGYYAVFNLGVLRHRFPTQDPLEKT
jgi:hypothetical protein